MKLWHLLVVVAIVTVCLWASNNVPFYGKLVS